MSIEVVSGMDEFDRLEVKLLQERIGTGEILLNQGKWIAYTDESLGEGIFREYPDGRIEKIDYQNGSFKVLEVVRESTK